MKKNKISPKNISVLNSILDDHLIGLQDEMEPSYNYS